MSTSETIVGVFKDETTAKDVINDLLENGFSRQDIHLSSENAESGETYQPTATGNTGIHEHHEHGFMGWLRSLFGSDNTEDDYSHRYSNAVGRGNCIVAVDTDENLRDRAVQVMNDHNAIDIDTEAASNASYASASASSGQRSSTTAPNLGRGDLTDARQRKQEGNETIPVIEEEFKVGKRVVQRGGVRIYSKIVQTPVEEQVRLREENVTVDRRSVDRAVNASDRDLLRDQTIEVTESSEEPVFSKTARVVEEVVVGKDVSERTETVRDTVRHTQVDIEPITGQTAGSTGTAGDWDSDFRSNYQTQYVTTGDPYEYYAPAYEFGSRYGNDPEYSGRSFEDAEERLRTDYLRNNPNSAWDRVRGAVRYGWEKVTRKR